LLKSTLEENIGKAEGVGFLDGLGEPDRTESAASVCDAKQKKQDKREERRREEKRREEKRRRLGVKLRIVRLADKTWCRGCTPEYYSLAPRPIELR